MALQWFDGFENYNNDADMNALSNINVSSIAVSASSGRRSTRSIYMQDNADYCCAEVTGTPGTIIVGFAILIGGGGVISYNASYPFLALYDVFNPIGSIHVRFHLDSGRYIKVYNGSGTLLGTSSESVGSGYYYIEVKVVISNTVGQVTIKLNEDEILNTSADKDTQNGSNAYVGCVALSGVYNYRETHFDDFYICDTTGSKNNDFLGDIRVDVLRPNGAGTHTEFTPSAGSNYQNVDESYPDDDTTYNYSSTVNHKDTYALESLEVLGATIHGVKNQATMRKDDVGTRKAKIISRLNGADYLGDEETLTDSYKTFVKIYDVNPDDSADFEEADIAGMESGAQVTA